MLLLSSGRAADTISTEYGSGSNTLLDFYQRELSPVKGGNRCAMYPSCSQYSKLLYATTDAFSAFTGTCDRLVRCGRDADSYLLVSTDDGLRREDQPNGETVAATPASSAPLVMELDTCTNLDFAETLLRRGKEYLAAIEFERLLASPSLQGACRRRAHYNLLECTSRTGSIDAFRASFYEVIDSLAPDSLLASRAGLLLARRLYSSGNYTDALQVGNHYLRGQNFDAERCFIAALCLLNTHAYAQAQASASGIPPSSPLAGLKDSLTVTRQQFYSFERSPFAAAALSTVVPGAGYLYAGRPSTAAFGLVVCGLFAWTTTDFFRKGEYGAASTALVLGSGIYAGMIQGSVKAVKRRNQALLKKRTARIAYDLNFSW